MEKRKYDITKYADMCEEVKVAGVDGTEITVVNHIPYRSKEAMAVEMANIIVSIHDEDCVYLNNSFDKVLKLMIAKYYTDIDTEDVDEHDVADFFVNNGMFGKIIGTIEEDLDVVIRIYEDLVDGIVETYKYDKSIAKAIRTSFGFLFNGEDISQSLAKAEATTQTMSKAYNALKEKEKSINKGKMNVGGQLINLARKNP